MNVKATQEKQEWTTPALTKMDISEITKSGEITERKEDPHYDHYGPNS